jgi:tetratricopeptide (TPR) repeat protein
VLYAPPSRSEQALELYRRLGDGGGAARILDGRAMATFLDGRIVDAVDQFHRAASLFQDAGELLRVITPRSTRGHGLVFLARAAEGLTETSAALRLARELDAPEGWSYALWHRSEALSALGRHAEAEADARESLDVAIRCAHRGWTATAYRALGIALQTRGSLDEAVHAFEASAATAGEDLTLFASWAAARAASVAVVQGRLGDADRLVRRALAAGPPLARYEARLAAVELAVARGDPAAREQAGQAEAEARAGGHLVSAERLAVLARL